MKKAIFAPTIRFDFDDEKEQGKKIPEASNKGCPSFKKEVLDAFEEAEILSKNPNSKRYNNFQEAMIDLDQDNNMNDTINALIHIWTKNKELRLGQLILNAVPEDKLYYMENDKLINKMKELYFHK